MTFITRIRTLKGAGVLADRAAKDTFPVFPRYSLVYGFNGSGKSTLSRLFSSLQAGKCQEGLPEGCAFELELEGGAVLKSPDELTGLQERVCVFNTDFIERNLQWNTGTANSIFYISEEQAEAAAALKAAEVGLPALTAALAGAEQSLEDKNRILTTFKRGLAKNIAAKIHLSNRKYEAPALQADYENLKYDATAILDSKKLDELEGVAIRLSPPPTATAISANSAPTSQAVVDARLAASTSAGESMAANLVDHPEMVPWAKQGYEYHRQHKLGTCLLCAGPLTEERTKVLAAAFDDALTKFVAGLSTAQGQANASLNRLELAVLTCSELKLMPELDAELKAKAEELQQAMVAIRSAHAEIKRIYVARIAAPTLTLTHKLPSDEAVETMSTRFTDALSAVNAVIDQHNKAVAEFGKHQDEARISIKRHFLAEAHTEFKENIDAVDKAQKDRDKAQADEKTTKDQIKDLRNKVRTHGPAAAVITKLVHLYLGHQELSVVTAKDGYELHRHGKLVKGPPSEGEKTALALCYFLSTLESDGRKLADLIVVVDDPVSSLDTKAMNYACAMVYSRLKGAKQLFVLTHNQHCMNEFKKFWKSEHKATPQTAALLFLDVKVSNVGGPRSASLVELPSQLRVYDSEYHFLCMKVLEFEKAGTGHSEYGYLMPNIIRRVLELFLAFKVPGTHPIKDKLEAMTKLHPGLDKTRMVALERLSQVESHSDTLEDFISHSSMTIEETRDASAALLELMQAADENHTAAIRKQCKAA